MHRPLLPLLVLLPLLALLPLLGCPVDTGTDEPAATFAATPGPDAIPGPGAPPGSDATVGPAGDPGASGADASTATGEPPRPPGPALGPGAGAVFHGDQVVAQANGGLETLRAWDAVGVGEAKLAACKEAKVTLQPGLVFLVCTRAPIDGPKTGWMKVEVTGRDGAAWTFRYLHWPSQGGEALAGTGRWVPDATSPSLTYTHDDDVVGTKGTPPSGPALTEPVPSGPAPGMDKEEPAPAEGASNR